MMIKNGCKDLKEQAIRNTELVYVNTEEINVIVDKNIQSVNTNCIKYLIETNNQYGILGFL